MLGQKQTKISISETDISCFPLPLPPLISMKYDTWITGDTEEWQESGVCNRKRELVETASLV